MKIARSLFTLALVAMATALVASASVQPPGAPEIDGSSAITAVTLLSGALMVLRSRKR